MTLQWISVAAFLYTELGVALLLSIGFISNPRWKSILTSRLLTSVTYHGTFFFGAFVLMLLVLFCDSSWTTYKLSQIDMSNVDLRNNPQAEIQAHMKMFRAERNMYMTGFSLFMLIILRRLIVLITVQARQEAVNQAAIKQAQGAHAQATKLMTENEDLLKKKSGGGGKSEGEEAVGVVAEEKNDLLLMVETLKQDLDETTNKLETAEADLGAMKAQSEGLHREYDRVVDIHNELEKKLER